MIKILLAEDDRDLNRLVCMSLRNAGYEVTSTYDGAEALAALESMRPNMVITDLMMPRVDGFELAEGVKQIDADIPIVFMTARDDKPSQMRGYRIGIDDYVIKPFDTDVLLMRISAILRRARIEEEKCLRIGNLRMSSEERSATVDGEEISLTAREFNLLFKLLSYPKKTFTRSALMEEFWDYDSSATSRTVDVYMAKLREKTSGCDGFEILTVHGLGYKAVLK
ncbi:MAG: response regulator transcription factor [Clostridia bacterium]|nr:response regulator transcription factor [Clostridia bacterium]